MSGAPRGIRTPDLLVRSAILPDTPSKPKQQAQLSTRKSGSRLALLASFRIVFTHKAIRFFRARKGYPAPTVQRHNSRASRRVGVPERITTRLPSFLRSVRRIHTSQLTCDGAELERDAYNRNHKRHNFHCDEEHSRYPFPRSGLPHAGQT
jgi:hypothetical protein